MNYRDEYLDSFFYALEEFALEWMNFKTYENMTDEKRRKCREKLTIVACYQFSPRKNYDISKDTIREFVTDVIERNRIKVEPE
jgi:hypothetical protein